MKEKIKLDNISLFKAISLLCFAFLIIIYELGYCNLKAITIEHSYNFSLARIVIYGIAIILVICFGKKISDRAEPTFENKKIIIFTLLIFSLLLDFLQLRNVAYTSTKMDTVYQLYGIVLLLLAEINALLFVMYLSKDFIVNIILTTLTFGIFFSYSMPFFHQVDEKVHFLTCLNFSVGNFNLYEGHAVTDTDFDEITMNMPSKDFAATFFDKKCNFNLSLLSFDDNKCIPSTYRTPIAYIPGTIGILFARMFGGSIADVFIMGRLMNVLTFGALLVIMFKIMPFKKRLFYVIYLQPIALALASTYNTDGITIGLIGIFIAYVFKLYNENKETISMKEFLLLVLTYALVLTCKDSSYMGIGFLVFILPIKKYLKNNKKMLLVTLCLVLLTVAIGFYEINIKTASNQGDERTENTNSILQLENIKNNPGKLAEVYSNFTKSSLLRLTWYNNLNPKYFFGNEATVVAFGMFVLALYISYTDVSIKFDRKAKIILFLAFVFTFGITTFALYWLYSPVGYDTIVGYQARYIIPFIPLLLAILNSGNKVKDEKMLDKNQVSLYDMSAFVLGALIFVDTISQALM